MGLLSNSCSEPIMLRKAIKNVSEFVTWVDQVGNDFIRDGEYETAWFRGGASSAYKLVPRIYRTETGRAEFADAELRAEFMRRAMPLVAERPPRDDWEWYFLMQHFRAPTRLLDWTDSALVALYFAITSHRSLKESQATPAVWAFNPWTLNRKTEKELDGPLSAEWDNFRQYLPKGYGARKRLPQSIPWRSIRHSRHNGCWCNTAISRSMDRTPVGSMRCTSWG